jgi:hypothetical protein
MKRAARFLPVTLFVLLCVTSVNAQAFFMPELPFCPWGGPPGWFNRVTQNDAYRYSPPAYGYAPYAMPGQFVPYDAPYRQPPRGNGYGNFGNGSCPWGGR